MSNLILVMCGGALGAGLRYGVGQLTPSSSFPLATLLVNLAGGLLMGLLAGAVARHAPIDGPLWIFLGAGVLGGFTTFSAFSLDAVTLIQRGAYGAAAAYIAASVLGAMALFAGGLLVTKAPA